MDYLPQVEIHELCIVIILVMKVLLEQVDLTV
mgnify:CR=1 FL=1